MMATPADLTDFAVGFNEGIVSAARDIESLDVIKTDDSTLLRRWLSGPPAGAFWERRSYLAGPRLSVERKAERTMRRADLSRLLRRS